MITLQKLLDQIKQVEEDIFTLSKLQECLGSQDESLRVASISFRGNYTVKFTQSDVDHLLQQRWNGLQVQLNRLLAAKEAAEKTAAGWMLSSGGSTE